MRDKKLFKPVNLIGNIIQLIEKLIFFMVMILIISSGSCGSKTTNPPPEIVEDISTSDPTLDTWNKTRIKNNINSEYYKTDPNIKTFMCCSNK